MKQTEDRDGGTEGWAWTKERRAHVWMTPEVVFAWKTAFHSPCLCLCLYSPYFLACCVQSERCFTCLQPGGKTELQSQAAKWWKTQASRDALSQDREKKCSLFNLAFSFLHFFVFFFFGVSFSSIRVSFFLSSYTSTCTPALERELLVGDGWMDGCSEEEDCKRTARDDIIVFMLMCSLNVDVISLLRTIKWTKPVLCFSI